MKLLSASQVAGITGIGHTSGLLVCILSRDIPLVLLKSLTI
jgi:hypothetical protein